MFRRQLVQCLVCGSWPVLLAVLGVSACGVESHPTLTQGEGAARKNGAFQPQQQREATEKLRVSTVDRSTALKLAQVFAFNQGVLRQPIDVSAEKQSSGNWLVRFAPGYFVTADGQGLGFSPYMAGESVIVSPDGCSSIIRRPWSPKDDLAERPEPQTASSLENAGVSEGAAILIARSSVIRKGLIPTDAIVDEQQLNNGEWLVSIVPDAYFAESHSAASSPALPPFVVYVDQAGNCRFVSGHGVEN
jgi:hypothetical protein